MSAFGTVPTMTPESDLPATQRPVTSDPLRTPLTPIDEATRARLTSLLPDSPVVRRRVYSTLLRTLVNLGDKK